MDFGLSSSAMPSQEPSQSLQHLIDGLMSLACSCDSTSQPNIIPRCAVLQLIRILQHQLKVTGNNPGIQAVCLNCPDDLCVSVTCGNAACSMAAAAGASGGGTGACLAGAALSCATPAAVFLQLAPQHCQDLQHLDLTSCHVGSCTVRVLAQSAAQQWSQLQVLILRSNAIDAAGAKTIAQHAAHHWPLLHHVDLSFNQLGNEGVMWLAKHAAAQWRRLKFLDLTENSLGTRGIIALAKLAAPNWHQLQQLYLGWNLGVTKAGAKALAKYAAPHTHNLTVLDISLTRIGDSGAAAVWRQVAAAGGHWRRLRQLDMSHTGLTDTFANSLLAKTLRSQLLQAGGAEDTSGAVEQLLLHSLALHHNHFSRRTTDLLLETASLLSAQQAVAAAVAAGRRCTTAPQQGRCALALDLSEVSFPGLMPWYVERCRQVRRASCHSIAGLTTGDRETVMSAEAESQRQACGPGVDASTAMGIW